MVFKYKTLIANVLVRTPVCKPTNSPGSQGKMCRAGFVQPLIANVLDRTPVCKVRAMVFPLKSRENSQGRISASLQRKRFRLNKVCKAILRPKAKRKFGKRDFYLPSTLTVFSDDPCATTYKQFGKICQSL